MNMIYFTVFFLSESQVKIGIEYITFSFTKHRIFHKKENSSREQDSYLLTVNKLFPYELRADFVLQKMFCNDYY